MKPITTTAPSLRQFEHTEEIYKYSGLPQDCPRYGDFAEITRSHCVPETGMLVKVIDYPHWCKQTCGHCWLPVFEWMVRVEPITDWMKWEVIAPGNPFFYPINWLKRWSAGQLTRADRAG